jgi:hypothetical protein
MPALVMDHAASRWDRSVRSLINETKISLSTAAVTGHTEIAGSLRKKALRALYLRRLWRFMQRQSGAMAETGLAVKRLRYKVLRWNSVKIGPDLGPGDIVVASIAAIQDRLTGEIIVIGDAHMPASVQDKLFDSERGRQYRLALQRYRRLVNAWTRHFEPDSVIIWADWNLPINVKWVQDFFEREWPELRALRPSEGTHAGGRAIDFPLISGFRDTSLKVADWSPASDHKRVRFRGQPVKRKRKKKHRA